MFFPIIFAQNLKIEKVTEIFRCLMTCYSFADLESLESLIIVINNYRKLYYLFTNQNCMNLYLLNNGTIHYITRIHTFLQYIADYSVVYSICALRFCVYSCCCALALHNTLTDCTSGLRDRIFDSLTLSFV